MTKLCVCVCAAQLYVTMLYVKELCVCDKEEAAERRKEADGYRAEEQEPHTMMWGKGRKDDHEVGKVVYVEDEDIPKGRLQHSRQNSLISSV